MDKNNYITVKEVCEKYNISRETLRKWSKNGIVSEIRLSRKKILFDKDLLNKEIFSIKM